MLRLITRKTIQGLMMVLIVSMVTFALLNLAGGDAFSQLLDNPQISAATIENLRKVYGLDKPLATRYATWLGGAVVGELGESMYFRVPVGGLVWTRLVSTLALSVAALGIAVIVSFGLGIAAARYKNRWLERLVEAVVFLTASTPRIVLALFALAIVARATAAYADATSVMSFWFAAAAMATPLISIFLAQLHDGLTETMAEDFVQLARAKGLSESVIVARHAIRAALNPVLTVFGISLGGLLGGSVIVESVLGREGLGTLMVSAVRGRDLPLVMGIVLATSTAVWLGNTLAELLQAWNDKRMRV
ncbi:MAG TPA: ABC transporter permease [Pyrinomonadaceae bacterium]|nr:ABC transporter permease [Pyrinomonadaceae bacterium]